jgi:hypothetical protein
MTNCKTPCPQCAFRRDSERGIEALGGSLPEVYVGQLHGPFVIPCHMHYPKDAKSMQEVRAKAFDIPQCAGAAVLRANLGRDKELHPSIHRLPADTETVFANYAQFYAHHKGISVFEAERQLTVLTPDMLLEMQQARSTNLYKVMP